MNFDHYVCEGQMSFADYLQAEIKKLEEPFKIDKPIRLIELFAGVGSQAMALRDIGADFTHHLAVEIDKYAIASYNAIHGTNFPTIDITKLKGGDLGITNTDKFCYILTYSFP